MWRLAYLALGLFAWWVAGESWLAGLIVLGLCSALEVIGQRLILWLRVVRGG